MEYHNDYETEPIGDGNPYHLCIHCKRSAPEINGRLEKHETWCKYRQQKERGEMYEPFQDEDA